MVTPVVLAVILWDSLRQELAENYEGYPTGFLLVTGWGVAIGALAFGVLAALPRWRGAELAGDWATVVARSDACTDTAERPSLGSTSADS